MIFNFTATAEALSKALDGRFFVINEQVLDDPTFPILKTVQVELFERVNGKMERRVLTQIKDRVPDYLREECIERAEKEFLKQLFIYVHTNERISDTDNGGASSDVS